MVYLYRLCIIGFPLNWRTLEANIGPLTLAKNRSSEAMLIDSLYDLMSRKGSVKVVYTRGCKDNELMESVGFLH